MALTIFLVAVSALCMPVVQSMGVWPVRQHGLLAAPSSVSLWHVGSSPACRLGPPRKVAELAALWRLRGGMNVNVRTLSGKTITVELSPDESVESLKQKIRDKEGIPPEQQRIIFGARHLDPLKSVSDYDIEDGSTLNLVLRLRGG